MSHHPTPSLTGEVKMLLNKQIRAAVFDLWQTLIHTDSVNSVEVWQKYVACEATSIQQAMDGLEGQFMMGEIKLAAWPYEVAKRAGIKLTRRQASAIRCDIQEAWIRESKPYPGAVEMLQELQAAGIKTAICSNANPFTLEVVKYFFGDYLDAIVVSCKVKVAKPDPKIFEAVLMKLKVSVDEAAYSGDGGHREIERAKELGFQTILVCSKEGHVALRPESDPGEAADERVDLVSQIVALLLPSRAA